MKKSTSYFDKKRRVRVMFAGEDFVWAKAVAILKESENNYGDYQLLADRLQTQLKEVVVEFCFQLFDHYDGDRAAALILAGLIFHLLQTTREQDDVSGSITEDQARAKAAAILDESENNYADYQLLADRLQTQPKKVVVKFCFQLFDHYNGNRMAALILAELIFHLLQTTGEQDDVSGSTGSEVS